MRGQQNIKNCVTLSQNTEYGYILCSVYILHKGRNFQLVLTTTAVTKNIKYEQCDFKRRNQKGSSIKKQNNTLCVPVYRKTSKLRSYIFLPPRRRLHII